MQTRRLTGDDVALAVKLTNQEGWGFDAAEIRRLLQVGGGYVIEDADEPLGLLTATRYPGLAWIGNVIVRPEHRGKGVGGRLLQDTLDDLERDGIDVVGLYSVLPAVSLYARAGFERIAPAESLTTTTARPLGAPGPDVRPMEAGDLDAVVAFDTPRFGASRRRLFEVLFAAFPDASFVLERDGTVAGYGIGKPSASGSEVGPIMTEPGDRDGLAALFDAVLAALPEGGVEAGIRSENPLARELLQERGFSDGFPALTMIRGASKDPGRPAAVGAVGGMEKG